MTSFYFEKTKHSMRCFCSVCDRQFEYADENSPMLKDEVWHDIVAHYGLQDHERYAEQKRLEGYTYPTHLRQYHTFICYKCMEKALGRRIEQNDLMEVPFNYNFINNYYDPTPC